MATDIFNDNVLRSHGKKSRIEIRNMKKLGSGTSTSQCASGVHFMTSSLKPVSTIMTVICYNDSTERLKVTIWSVISYKVATEYQPIGPDCLLLKQQIVHISWPLQ